MVEEIIGHKPFFSNEPDKNQPGDEPNHAGCIADLGIFAAIFGENDMLSRPEIPVGNLAEEALVQLGTVEGFLPGLVQLHEVGEAVPAVCLIQREVKQDFDVGSVRVDEIDVFDQGDLFKYILEFITLMQTAVDYR
ncbi:MAG: hypothetical protein DDT26_02657 [Dehalococcoidia bacterium]|nr:hypothetical protein [Chloroflexota bacterium]